MNISTDGLKRGIQDIAFKYKIETKSAFKAAVIIVLVLIWKDVLERGSKWIGAKIEQKWDSPTSGALASAAIVTLIGVILIYLLSLD